MFSDILQEYWTILVLPPPFRDTSILQKLLFTIEMNIPKSRLVLTMAQLICTTLNEACIGWKTLHGHIDELLGTGDEIF